MKSRRKWIDPEDFHMMRRQAGITILEASALLDVTARTIRNWEQGFTKIPYMAYRVLKMVNGHVFTQSWDGWFVRGDTLYSPTQRGFKPHELTYLSNYLWMARKWLAEREQARNDSLVDAARHVDCNLNEPIYRHGQPLFLYSEAIICPLLTVFSTDSRTHLRQIKATESPSDAKSARFILRTLLNRNTSDLSKNVELRTHLNQQKSTTYTLCEVKE